MKNKSEQKMVGELNAHLRDAVQEKADRMPPPRFNEVYNARSNRVRLPLLKAASIVLVFFMLGGAGYGIYRYREQRTFVREGIELFLGSLYESGGSPFESDIASLPADTFVVEDPILRNVENIFESWNLP